MSALITAEWYMRKNHFPGWARPFEFNALLYDSIGRHEEARDGVRSAASSWLRLCPRQLTGPFRPCRSVRAAACCCSLQASVQSPSCFCVFGGAGKGSLALSMVDAQEHIPGDAEAGAIRG